MEEKEIPIPVRKALSSCRLSLWLQLGWKPDATEFPSEFSVQSATSQWVQRVAKKSYMDIVSITPEA